MCPSNRQLKSSMISLWVVSPLPLPLLFYKRPATAGCAPDGCRRSPGQLVSRVSRAFSSESVVKWGPQWADKRVTHNGAAPWPDECAGGRSWRPCWACWPWRQRRWRRQQVSPEKRLKGWLDSNPRPCKQAADALTTELFCRELQLWHFLLEIRA